MLPADSGPPYFPESAALEELLNSLRERLAHLRSACHTASEACKEDGITQAEQLLDAAMPLLTELARLQGNSHLHGPESELVASEALHSASLGYIEIYCTKEAWERVKHLKKVSVSAEAYVRVMVRAQSLSTDPDLLALLDSNLKLAQELLRTSFLPPPPPPRWKLVLAKLLEIWWSVMNTRVVSLKDRDGCAVYSCALVIVLVIYKLGQLVYYVFESISSAFRP